MPRKKLELQNFYLGTYTGAFSFSSSSDLDFTIGFGVGFETGDDVDGTDLNADIGFLMTEVGVTFEDLMVSNNFFSPTLASFNTEGITFVGRAINLSSSVDGTLGILIILSDLGRLGLALIGAVTTGTDDTDTGDDDGEGNDGDAGSGL